METAELTAARLFAASWHLDQTPVVWALIEAWYLSTGDFSNVEDPSTGEGRPVYEWHLFTQLRANDYFRLGSAGFPLLICQFGTWVGLDERTDDYDESFHPKVLKALFGIVTDGVTIRAMRAAKPVGRTCSDRVKDIVGSAASG